MNKIKRQNKGQVAIIVLLISAVAMTIGLSVSKRTTVETKIDIEEEQLKQAFNTAESGLEFYLKTGDTAYVGSDGSTATIVASEVGVGTTISIEQLVLNGVTQYYWLVAHDNNGNINPVDYYTGNSLSICVDNAFNGAMKVDFFYVNGTNYGVWRNGYNVATADTVNGYDNIAPVNNSCITGRKTVTLNNIPLGGGNIPLLLSVRLINSSSRLALVGDGANDFPSQGRDLSSTGVVGNGVTQKVKIFYQYRIPTFMLDGVTANNVLSN